MEGLGIDYRGLMIKRNNKEVLKSNILFPISIIAVLIGYYFIYINRCYPVSEGWHVTYAKLLLNGKIPYKDYYYYMPPLDIFIDVFLWSISGKSLLLFRVYRLVERILLTELLYYQLKKLVKPFYAWFAVIMGGILISSSVYDLLGDYNQTVYFLAVILASILIHFVETRNEKKKILWLFLAGFVMGLCIMHKQTLAYTCVVSLFTLLIIYCVITKDNFIKRFLQALAGAAVSMAIIVLYFGINGALKDMVEQIFGSASAKSDGGFANLVFTPLLEVFSNLQVLVISLAIIGVFLCVMDKSIKSRTKVMTILIFVIGWGVYVVGQSSWLTSLKLSLHTGYFWILAVMIVSALFIFKKEEREGDEVDIGKFFFIILFFFVVEYLLIRNFNDFTYQWYMETELFKNLELLSSVCFELIIVAICYLVAKWHRGGVRAERTLEWLVLCTASFMTGYAGILTARNLVITSTMVLSVPICMAVVLNLQVKHNWLKNCAIVIGGLFVCFICMSQKITCAYSWWGTTEAELSEEKYPIHVSGLEGFKVSEGQAKLFEEIVKVIENNTTEESTIFGFPGVTVFNLLTDHMNMVQFAPVNFYDTCGDKYAEEDAERLRANPPDIVVWWDIPGCLETHEAVFRGGNQCGQRQIIYWFSEAIDNYTLIGQVSNIFVYKLNNGQPVNYIYIETPERQAQTIFSAPVSQSVEGIFEGEGTEENPYLIADIKDLENLRDLVNEGENFEDTYFYQVCDLDLATIENWVPIGSVHNMFCFSGIYNGGGHKIKNLTVVTEYASLFELTEGTIMNLGIENGALVGDCAGGIVGHAYNSAQVINCYFKGSIAGKYRAGGIVDNLGGGSVINCYFDGIIEAPEAYGIVGYCAGRVIDCISTTNKISKENRIARTKNNITVNENTDTIKLLNRNTKNIKNYGYEGVFNLWDSGVNGVELDKDTVAR